MTRVALLDYSDWIQSMDPNLYGALSGETSYMTGTEIQAVWKTDPPILIQDRDDYLAVYAAGDPVGYFASGPFPFGPGETIDFVMAYVAGETKPDMYSTADFAITTYKAQFQTSGPPPSPTLKAAGTLAGTHGMVYDSNIHAYQIYYTPSGSVTLYWDGGPSEMTLDAITGNIEFEGYRIYKSTNRGATWGNPITDTQGNRIGWTPFAKFDLNNGIKGPDLSGSGKYLGDDTGLQHSFTDIDVMDGYEYWYAITAYDYAPPLKSYESAIGNSPTAPNVVSVMTGSAPSGMVMGTVSSTAPLPLVSGPASAGSASVSVVDLMALQNATYRITTVDSAKYNGELVANRLGVTLTNVTTGTILLDALMPDDVDLGSGLLPVVNGVTIDVNTVFNSTTADDRLVDYTFPTGLGSAAGWPLVYGADFLGSSLDPADINDAARFFSMEVRFDTLETQMAYASHYPTAWYISSYQEVPFTVWDVSSVPERQVNVAYRIMAPGTVPTFRLTTNYLNRHYMYFLSSDYSGATADTAYLPGGTLNYVRSNDVVYAGWWNLEGTATSEKDLHGLVFSVEYLVPMGPGAVYQFSTTASAIDAAQVTLDDIKVVPNPYYIFERWDRNINSRKLQFINVPENATIDIYTLAGELVASLDHGASYNADKIGVVDWNMWTYEFTEAAYGLYLYVVKTDDGQTKVGKFAIIR